MYQSISLHKIDDVGHKEKEGEEKKGGGGGGSVSPIYWIDH